MNEGKENPLFDLLGLERLNEVGTYSPILLRRIKNLIVYPSTSGGLEQWMVQEEGEPTTGSKDSRDLGDRCVDILDVFKDQACYDGIEGCVTERQLRGFGTGVGRPTGTFTRLCGLGQRWIDPDDTR